jgi:outer membrane immunogenic protein
LPLKSPPPLPPVLPVFSWTGLYVGGHFGAGFGNIDWFEDASETAGGGPVGFHDAAIDSAGVLGGAQLGFNYQSGWAVAGIQADASGAGIMGNTFCFPQFVGVTVQTCNSATGALGTLTARVGAAYDRSLFYVLGGWAWQDEKLQNFCAGCSTNPTNAAFSGVRSGYTLGAGIEYALPGNWSIFAQYNFIGFGTQDLKFNTVLFAPGFGPGTGFTENIRETINVVKAGINYKFGPTLFSNGNP